MTLNLLRSIHFFGFTTGKVPLVNGCGASTLKTVSNVDRLTSIWQLLNPTKFFDHPQDGDLSPNADLKPFFRDSQRTSWNSHDARETDRWGYTYDILHRRANQSDEEYLSNIRKTINERYGQTRKDLSNFPKISGKENDYIVDIIYDR